MAIIYATLIIKGKKTFADVPDKLKAHRLRTFWKALNAPNWQSKETYPDEVRKATVWASKRLYSGFCFITTKI